MRSMYPWLQNCQASSSFSSTCCKLILLVQRPCASRCRHTRAPFFPSHAKSQKKLLQRLIPLYARLLARRDESSFKCRACSRALHTFCAGQGAKLLDCAKRQPIWLAFKSQVPKFGRGKHPRGGPPSLQNKKSPLMKQLSHKDDTA